MYYRLAVGAPLYRVTSPGVGWPNPVRALGAFYTRGGRYNGPSQPTVYCTEDPLAAIAEAAFYEALERQYKISRHRNLAVTYPLVSTLTFWAFSLSPAPTFPVGSSRSLRGSIETPRRVRCSTRIHGVAHPTTGYGQNSRDRLATAPLSTGRARRVHHSGVSTEAGIEAHTAESVV